MIKKLNNEQQTMVSGGGSYCKFDDGTVLICYTGERSIWKLYETEGEAIGDSKLLDPSRMGIGTFTPRQNSSRFSKIRKFMQDNDFEMCVSRN